MNFLFAIKLSSDILQALNIYKLWENSIQICVLSIAIAGTGIFLSVKGNNLCRKISKHVVLESNQECAKDLLSSKLYVAVLCHGHLSSLM